MDEHIDPEKLIAFVDGEANEEEAAAIRKHLESCPRCGEDVENLRFLGGRVNEAGPLDSGLPEARLKPALSRALDREAEALLSETPASHQPGPGLTFRKIALALSLTAAAAAIVLTISHFLTQDGSITPQSERIALAQTRILTYYEREDTRGDTEPDDPETAKKRFRIEFTLEEDGYLAILKLDRRNLIFLFPFIRSNDEIEYYGLNGFEGGKKHFYPPPGDGDRKGYEGYHFPQPGKTDYYFLIPSKKMFTYEGLTGMDRELTDMAKENKDNLPELSDRILKWLDELYPGTTLEEVRESNH